MRFVFIGACILLATVGQLEFGRAACYIGIGLIVALITVETTRASSAQERMEKRLENAQPCACMFTGAPAAATTGLWKGIRVQVGSTSDGLRVGVPLASIPAELDIVQRGDAGDAGRTGDESFDRLMRVSSNDAAWRWVLTSEPRRLLQSLCDHAAISLHDGALDVQLLGSQSKKLEAIVDLAVAFAASLPEPPRDTCGAVFMLARTEPVSGVRAGHYRWLAERGWNTHEVYRTAATDPDLVIARWGSSHVAPSDGVFR